MEAQMRYRKALSSTIFGGQKKAPKLKPKSTKRSARAPASSENDQTQPQTQKSERRRRPQIDFVQRNIDDAACPRNRQRVERPETLQKGMQESIQMTKRRNPERIARKSRSEGEIGRYGIGEEVGDDIFEQRLFRIESQTLERQHRELEEELQDIDRSMDVLKQKYVFVPE
jgi:hypothetical protein